MQPVIQYINLFIINSISRLILYNSIHAKTLAVGEGTNPALTQSRNKLIFESQQSILKGHETLFSAVQSIARPRPQEDMLSTFTSSPADFIFVWGSSKQK